MARPTIIAALVLVVLFVFSTIISGSQGSPNYTARLFTGVGSIGYILIWYYLGLPVLENHPEVQWISAVMNGILLGFLYTFHLQGSVFYQDLFILLVACVTTALCGRWPTYVFLAIVMVLRAFFARTIFSVQPNNYYLWVGIPLVTIILTEVIQALRQIIFRHMTRMETIKNVARSLGSSLETHQVVSLLSAVVQKSFQADTYYVGLVKEGKIHLELFFDDGEFFPSQDVPLGGNLASWVIRNKNSLLLSDLSKDAQRLNIPYMVIGTKRTSRSWMGAPIELGGDILGLIAVASYSPRAYDQVDLSLLESIAQQAALAIVNSYHHAEVQHQSHLDSLTGVYNHGYFLISLAKEAEEALQNHASLSLIMLDIDHFKQYNDTYGHLVGDQVLSMLVKNIRAHVKSSDVVGRWGGEEFVILLRNTVGSQANKVAERIQQSMETFIMTERDQKTIPSPTVSQGIALFPDEAVEIYKLVDLADQRLYQAKQRGRNQIEPKVEYWQTREENSNPLPQN
ncbi:MAG TPA: diguanylate cyclase [Anaerolineaceae bacterium]|nr:diguanylate cyclase [Anaerolineaceae bacterium]